MAKKKKKKTANKNKAGAKTAKSKKQKKTGSSSSKKQVKKSTSKKKGGKGKKNSGSKKSVAKKQVKKVEKPKQEPKPKHKEIVTIMKVRMAKELRGPIIAIASFLALFILFHLSSTVLVFSLYNTVLPGTSVAGVDISSLTLDEVQNKLMERGQPFLDSSIPVTLDNETQNFTPKELGISLLPRNTLQEVEFVDFKNTNIATILASMLEGRKIPFYVSVDVEKAQKTIEERFAFADKKSADAYLAFEDGSLTIVPEKPGKAIDTRALYKDIKARANELSSAAITLKAIDHQPLITQESLEAEIENIEDSLYNNIYLYYENWDWAIMPADHLDWLTFEYHDTFHIGDIVSFDLGDLEEEPTTLSEPLSLTKELQVSINPDPFLAYIEEEISPILETEPQDVSIYKDENDEIVIEGKGENGQTIKDEYLISALELAINNDLDEVPIPVQINKANVEVSDELKLLGIETLIGTGRSAFAGSPPNRIHNINTGIAKYNGLLIAPGETFSFNEHVGPVDAAGGYLPELVIKPEGTIPEYGGGLCQVSSTIYRAALMSGLPIVERAPHSYAVSYYAQIYGYGLDATIYIGVHDVKFINDTPGHILIQAYTEGTQAFYKFYGTDDGRTVEMEGPYLGGYHAPGPATIIENPSLAPGARVQVEYGHTGFNATWYRHLVKDGEEITETIYSAYRAIPAKIMVGPSAGGEEE